MSSASRDRIPVGAEREESPVSHHSQDTELIEQLQLELEEARRTIRSHETKILALQDGWRSFWANYDRFVHYLWRDTKRPCRRNFKSNFWGVLVII